MKLVLLAGLLVFSGIMLAIQGNASMLVLSGIVVGALLCISLVGHGLARCGLRMAEEILSRTFVWWYMVAVFLLTLSTHRAVSFVFLSLLCFSALREFYSLMPMKEVAGDKTLAFKDRVAVLFSYLAVPIVAWVAYIDWFELFIIVVPVYLFLLFPIVFVLQGRTEGALKSLGVVSVGSMFFVFNLGHCLFMIHITPMLLFYCFTLTEARDVIAAWSESGFARLAAAVPGTSLARLLRYRVSAAVDAGKTWAAGLVSSLAVAGLSLAFVPLMPPFPDGVFSWQVSLVLGLLIGFLGLMGELVFAMVKRDLHICHPDGALERVDSLVFTLPIAFHVVNWIYFLALMRALFQIVVHAFARILLRVFYGLRMPRRITEHPCVIVANHNTHLDVFVLFALVPLLRVPRLRAVAASDYFGAGVMGWLGRLLFNVVLVDRAGHGHHDDPLQPIVDAVAAGHSLIVFPEGSRGEPGQVGSFKAGIGELALRFPEITIQPVALVGIERTMPRHRPLPVPFSITALLAEPLRVADLDLPDDHRAARRLIATELQQRIEAVLAPETKSLALLRAASFDGDMTLWDFQKLMRHALAIVLEELKQRVPSQTSAALTIDRMIEIREAVATELKGKVTRLEEIRYQAFRRTLAAIGQPDDGLARDLNALYLKHRFEDTELYPDVRPTLDALRPHLRIGLLSNGNSYPDRCGLQDHFQFVVFSQDVGIEKPASGIFLVACEQVGCRPQELLHVGDSLEADVAGANAVGAISVWLNRDGRENRTGIVPDYEIHSLDELPGLLHFDTSSSP